MAHKLKNINKGGRILLALLAITLTLTGCSSPKEDMIKIPAGEFIMGSDEVDTEGKAMQYGSKKPWFLNENPKHQVTLKEFYIDKTETTNREYLEFVQQTSHTPPMHWRGATPPEDIANHPVVNISWFDAKDYCQWRDKRLPTEAEWEKAARGMDALRFPWGDKFDIKKLNTHGINGGTVDVGSYKDGVSPYGLLDTAGNAQEWVQDSYKPYPGSDYEDSDFGERFKIVRGGGWGGVGHYSSETYVRTTQRTYAPPGGRYDDVGVRCAW